MLLEIQNSSDLTNSQNLNHNYLIQKTNPISVPKIQKLIHSSKTRVYEVIDDNSNKKLAMKVFPIRDDKISLHYFNEKRFQNLAHQNVISIHRSVDVVSDNQTKSSYLLMDLAVCDFELLIRSKVLKKNEKLSRTYFHQLISGLEYLHSQGVFHLDLKPENLLLGDELKLKITDFDHSYKIGDLQVKSVGTSNYRAPEVFNRSVSNLAAADIYSSAIILFVWIIGFLPYLEDKLFNKINLASVLLENPDKFWDIYSKIIKNSTDDVSQEFQELFLGMTCQDPNERLTIEQIKQTAWYQGPVYSLEEMVKLDNLTKLVF